MNASEILDRTGNDKTQTPPAIQLSGISKSFANGNQTIEVLKNVNLTVPPQAIVGLIGTSGSGKSTLLNIISGIVKPDRGQVCICGAASEEFNDWCSISYMFQDDCCPGAPQSTTLSSPSKQAPSQKRSAPGALSKRCNWSSLRPSQSRFRINSPAACAAASRSRAVS